MDKKTAVAFHQEVIDTLNALAKKHDLQLGNVRGSYNDNGFTVSKLEFSHIGDDGIVKSKAMNMLGIHYPQLVGKTFIHHGQEIQFTGYNSRAYKMPLQYTTLKDGKKWKAGSHIVDTLREVA